MSLKILQIIFCTLTFKKGDLVYRKDQNQYLIVLLDEKVFTIKMCR